MQTAIAEAHALILDMLHSEGMREIVDALPEGAVLPILRPILEALSPTQCAHYLRGASAAPTTPARSPSLSPSTTAVNPRSPLSLPPPPLPRPSSPFGPRLTTPDCLLCRLLNVLNASVEAAPECLALGPSLLWYPLWLLAALQQTLSSTTSEELWPGDSFHWVLLPTPSTLTPLLPLHTLPVLIQSYPLLPSVASSVEPVAISAPTVMPTSPCPYCPLQAPTCLY
jgi:hypothetical protein